MKSLTVRGAVYGTEDMQVNKISPCSQELI